MNSKKILLLLFLGLFLVTCVLFNLLIGQADNSDEILKLAPLVLYGAASVIALFMMRKFSLEEELVAASKAKLIGAFAAPDTEAHKMLKLSNDQLIEKLNLQLESQRKAESMIFDFAEEIVCSIDAQYRITELNMNAESFLNLSFARLIGSSLPDYCFADERDRFIAALDQAKSEQTPVESELKFKRSTGIPIDLHWTIEWSPTAQSFYCTARDITQRKQIERLRAELTAMLSHDLRSPIAALSIFLDNLAQDGFGSLSESGRQATATCRDNVEQILRLINQLLDAERLESGNISVELHDLPVEAVIESAVNLIKPLADKRDIKIEISGNENNFLALADFDRCVQIILNIVSNAIKWSPDKGIVQIRQIADGDYIRIEIADQGPGISTAFREQIFGRFQTSNEPNKSSMASSGLGLYLSKKLVELQHGELGVNSIEGQGSCFWIRLKRFEIAT